MKFLRGKKTYAIAALSIIVSGLYGAGYIDDAQYKLICAILAPLGLIALRAGVSKASADKPVFIDRSEAQ